MYARFISDKLKFISRQSQFSTSASLTNALTEILKGSMLWMVYGPICRITPLIAEVRTSLYLSDPTLGTPNRSMFGMV